MKRFAAIAMLFLAFPALAQQQVEPSETTEKFGAWTVRCVKTEGEPEKKLCEVFLAVQGQGGPIAQIGLGQPETAGTLMVGRTPLGVLVSEPLTVSAGEANPAPITLPFVTCLANGCLAQAVIPGDRLGALTAQEAATVTFAERTGRKLQVNIPLNGLKDALTRVGLDCGSGVCAPAR